MIAMKTLLFLLSLCNKLLLLLVQLVDSTCVTLLLLLLLLLLLEFRASKRIDYNEDDDDDDLEFCTGKVLRKFNLLCVAGNTNLLINTNTNGSVLFESTSGRHTGRNSRKEGERVKSSRRETTEEYE